MVAGMDRMTAHRMELAAFVQVVRQQIETEGLRPFAMRTGIPLGQLRSFVAGRAARLTSLQSIASAMGMRLFIAPVEPRGPGAPPLPAELTRALGLTPDASVADAVDAIEQNSAASRLREGLRLMQAMTELARAAAEPLTRLVGESTPRVIPFAEHVRFAADTGEVEFDESSDLSVAVAVGVLPSWARADRLVCIRLAGDSPEPTAGALVVVDNDRQDAVDEQRFVVRIAEALEIKRLRQIGGEWHLVSDSLAHQPRAMTADDRIVGRVVWCGPRGAAVR